MTKEKIGMIQAMRICARYSKMNEEKRLALRRTRLERMVAWASENSPYYAHLYSGLPEAFTLSDLPPVNKVDLMANWDEWVTDRQITLSNVNEFMQNLDNIGRKLNGSYLVFTTSGSTGNPLVALCDHTTNNVMGAVNAARSFAHKEDMRAFIGHGGKTIGVFATEGFYLGNSSVRCCPPSKSWRS